MRSPAAIGTGLSRQGSDCSKGRSCSPSARDASVKSAKISVIVDRIGSMVQHQVRVADIYADTCTGSQHHLQWFSSFQMRNIHLWCSRDLGMP
jgi:hypothetical protein